MFGKIVLTFAVVLLVTMDIDPVKSRTTPPLEINVISFEEPCVRQGGICMMSKDCPPGDLVRIQVPLCPLQHNSGVVCCYIL